MFKHTICFLFAVQLLVAPLALSELYIWTDEKGIKHISDTAPADRAKFQKESETAFDPPAYNKETTTPEIKPKKSPPAPPSQKVNKPKKQKKVPTEESSNDPVIVAPSDGSYWKCSHHAGKNYKDLMKCAQDNFKSKKFDLSYNCSYCARELRPNDIEAIILNFKANYYSSHKPENTTRKFLIKIISLRLEEQPDDILVAFKKWVEAGKEVDAFVIRKP
jgi:uncharacterized protein DUF4124